MAEALIAFRDGGKDELAYLGAMLIAQGIQHLERCAEVSTLFASPKK
jgi:hypothetical protein